MIACIQITKKGLTMSKGKKKPKKEEKLDRPDQIIEDITTILHRHIKAARTEIRRKINIRGLDVNSGVMVQTSIHKRGLRDGFNNCLWRILGSGDGEIHPQPEDSR